MGVVHSVGYPDPDLSHFRGTDIRLSASDADEFLDTGWTGRALDTLDDDGDLVHTVDFRQVCAAVLRDWFALPQTTVDAALGGSFAAVPFLATSVAAEPGTAAPFGFQPDTPNPLRTTTDVRFTLARAAPVRVDVFDARGRRVTTLVAGERAAGAHVVRFDAGRLPAGVYVCRLESYDGVRTQRLTLAR